MHKELENNTPEKLVNLEVIAEHFSLSVDTASYWLKEGKQQTACITC